MEVETRSGSFVEMVEATIELG